MVVRTDELYEGKTVYKTYFPALNETVWMIELPNGQFSIIRSEKGKK